MDKCYVCKINGHIFIEGFLVDKYPKETLQAYKKLLSEALGAINRNLQRKKGINRLRA